jgi:hypothetical protein
LIEFGNHACILFSSCYAHRELAKFRPAIEVVSRTSLVPSAPQGQWKLCEAWVAYG